MTSPLLSLRAERSNLVERQAGKRRQAWRENIITTAVGTGEKGFAGDGGPAKAALLNGPFDVAFDAAGNLYFSDTFNNRIRRVDARSGVISTIAGNGEKGYSGDGGPATAASLNEPYGIVLDRAGNIFLADRLNRRVRRIDAASGIITTLAGTGEAGLFRRWRAGGSGRARRAERPRLRCGAAAPLHHRCRRQPGAGRRSGQPERSPPLPAPARPSIAAMAARRTAAGTFGARAVKVGADGTVYILERQGSSLRAVDPKTGVITTIAGTTARGYAGDGGPALAAVFDAPKEMAIDRDGSLLIVDTENHAIRRIDRRTGIVSAVAGGHQGSGGDGGPATEAGLDRPHGAVVGPDGAIYIGDTNNHRVRKVMR